MKAKQYIFEAYQDKEGWWRWRLTYAGKPVAISGRTYTRPHSALHAAVKMWQALHTMPACPNTTIVGVKYKSKTGRAAVAMPDKIKQAVEAVKTALAPIPPTLSSLAASLTQPSKRGKT